jgi:hypothetical protein
MDQVVKITELKGALRVDTKKLTKTPMVSKNIDSNFEDVWRFNELPKRRRDEV